MVPWKTLVTKLYALREIFYLYFSFARTHGQIYYLFPSQRSVKLHNFIALTLNPSINSLNYHLNRLLLRSFRLRLKNSHHIRRKDRTKPPHRGTAWKDGKIALHCRFGTLWKSFARTLSCGTRLDWKIHCWWFITHRPWLLSRWKKLCLRWRGPRRVVYAINLFAFMVEDLRNSQLTEIYSSLVKFHADASLHQTDIISHVLSSMKGMKFQRLLKHVDEDDEMKVLIRCSGLPPSNDTLESVQAVNNDVTVFLHNFYRTRIQEPRLLWRPVVQLVFQVGFGNTPFCQNIPKHTTENQIVPHGI